MDGRVISIFLYLDILFELICFSSLGAFRCLVEGGGHVAFVKHTTVYENTDGKRKEWWARNALNTDYQLLCPDGNKRD